MVGQVLLEGGRVGLVDGPWGRPRYVCTIDGNYRVITLNLKTMVIYPSVWRIIHYSRYPQFLQIFYIHMH